MNTFSEAVSGLSILQAARKERANWLRSQQPQTAAREDIEALFQALKRRCEGVHEGVQVFVGRLESGWRYGEQHAHADIPNDGFTFHIKTDVPSAMIIVWLTFSNTPENFAVAKLHIGRMTDRDRGFATGTHDEACLTLDRVIIDGQMISTVWKQGETTFELVDNPLESTKLVELVEQIFLDRLKFQFNKQNV